MRRLFEGDTYSSLIKLLLHLGSFITFRPSSGSAVRIKKIRPKGKIVLKKRDQTEKTIQRNRKQRRRESKPVYLHVQATP